MVKRVRMVPSSGVMVHVGTAGGGRELITWVSSPWACLVTAGSEDEGCLRGSVGHTDHQASGSPWELVKHAESQPVS